LSLIVDFATATGSLCIEFVSMSECDRSSPSLPELMGVGEEAIALSSPLWHAEMMEAGEGANVFC